MWFDLAPSWLPGEAQTIGSWVCFGACGRNLQGKAPHDVGVPVGGQQCVDEDAGMMLFKKS